VVAAAAAAAAWGWGCCRDNPPVNNGHTVSSSPDNAACPATIAHSSTSALRFDESTTGEVGGGGRVVLGGWEGLGEVGGGRGGGLRATAALLSPVRITLRSHCSHSLGSDLLNRTEILSNAVAVSSWQRCWTNTWASCPFSLPRYVCSA
jgi:hypothetical protein